MEKETIYKGVKFRTKLEARWAVFFDDCNAKWTYRPKTFDLGNGDYFTPEFLLENVHGRGGDSLYVVVRTSISKEEERIIDKFNKKNEVHKEYGYRLIKNKVLFVSNLPPIDLSDSRYYTQFGDSYEGTDITPFNFESIDGDYFTAHPGINKNGQFELFGDDSTYLDDMDKIKTENAYDDAKQSFWEDEDFDELFIKDKYKKLNKKIMICKECNSHIVLNKNESVDRCSRCGSENLEETPIPFIPLSYGEIKNEDMIEISREDLSKYCLEATSYNDQECLGWFLNKCVAKVTSDTRQDYYIYNEHIEGRWCHLTIYIRDKVDNSFFFLFQEDLMLGKEYDADNLFFNPVAKSRISEKALKELYNQALAYVYAAHSIFNYFAIKRKTEVIKVDVDRKSTKNETTKSGKVKVKKKHIVYMTDTLKVYTYDSSIAGKIRKHQPIFMPFWKVKQHTRRVFAKEDRHLPKEQRRIVRINTISPFLKGRERLKHSLSECEGTLYKIAR